MDKKKLIEMGLSEDQADSVMKGLDGEFIPKGRFEELNEAKQGLEKQLSERDKQLEELRKLPDAAALQQQIAELQKANADAQKAHETALSQAKLENAVELALTGAKSKNNKAVKALIDMEKVKLDGDKLTGLDDQLGVLRKEADYLFEPDAPPKNDLSGFKPAASGSAPPSDAGLQTQVNEIFGIQGGTV